MRIVLDVEANALINPDKLWVVVCKDIDTGEYQIFRNVHDDDRTKDRLIALLQRCTCIVGHNILGYDLPVLHRIIGSAATSSLDIGRCIRDTLIISKMAHYARKSHSIEDYGNEFNLPKIEWKDFSKYDERMVEYCKRDTDISHLVYTKYTKYIEKEEHSSSIYLENNFVYYVVNSLSTNGFFFNKDKAKGLLTKVELEISKLDQDILSSYPDRLVVLREFTPRATKFGTINRTSVPRILHDRIHEFEIGKTYPLTKMEAFNPSSHKQLITVLNEAGWRPVNKTDSHLETERELSRIKYRVRSELDRIEVRRLEDKLKHLETTGWKIDEENLSTLPPTAPASAKTLARRILFESRRRTLTEWLNLVQQDGRIHGNFQGIGAWTHRMAHQKPNTANIPNEFDTNNKKKILGKEMRQLWCAPKNRLLVGVDAEGIQLRIFAHYIDDQEFTRSLEEGKKEDKSDPHSLNQRILGPVCKTRQAAKRFIYALLLGGGIRKLATILDCEQVEAERALERLIGRYEGFSYLKREVIPKDARRGWFTGLDGRSVPIPSDTVGGRKHLAMSGYLQNGEKVVMAAASLKWISKLPAYDAILVDLVHDEWQIECPNDMKIALEVAEMVSSSLAVVGEELKLKCKLAGSYYNDDHKDYTIGTSWFETH